MRVAITTRSVDCDILCERSGQYPSRCKSCQAFRPTLRSSAVRQTRDNHDHTSSSATTAEKDDRMKSLHQALKLTKQKASSLRIKLWEGVESLEMYEIPVVSLTSDGAKPN